MTKNDTNDFSTKFDRFVTSLSESRFSTDSIETKGLVEAFVYVNDTLYGASLIAKEVLGSDDPNIILQVFDRVSERHADLLHSDDPEDL